jgi:hypothetical protein
MVKKLPDYCEFQAIARDKYRQSVATQIENKKALGCQSLLDSHSRAMENL